MGLEGAAIFLLLCVSFGDKCAGGPHAGIQTDGTTLGPNFVRPEGIVAQQCPTTHPFACANGATCTAQTVKPTTGGTDCNGDLVDLYSTCCPSDAVPCYADNGNARCRNNDAKGHFCPTSRPFAYKSGQWCCGEAYSEFTANSTTCTGGLLAFDDECCKASKAVMCSQDSGKLCQNNPHFGNLCPASHPYACAGGTKCALSPWKPSTGGGDCDGRRLTEGSICCPTSDVVDCNGDPSYKCKTYHGGRILVQLGADFAQEFYFADLRKQCMSSRIHEFPEAHVAGPAVGMFKEKVVVCGGEVNSSLASKKCYTYTPNAGWQYLGELPSEVQKAGSFRMNEGTTSERLVFAGGKDSDSSTKKVMYYDGTGLYNDDDMTPLPVGSTNSNFAQIDAERVMGVGGWTSDNNKKVIVYSSVYKNWTTQVDMSSVCTTWSLQGLALIGDTAYTSCASEYLVLAVNINTWTFTSAVTSFKFYINRMVAVDQDIFLIGRVKSGSEVVSIWRDGDAGEWSQMLGSIERPYPDQEWYASAVVPDAWFSC